MPDIQTTISELQHQISIDTLVITDLRNKVEKWHGLAKDIVTVLGNNTDMFHECMDSWIDLMVDTDERGTMKALAQNIVDRMHEIKHSEWNDPFSCMDKRTPVPDEYIPRPIPRHEYDMVCEASQHFSETYEQYCDRIHAQERAEYLHLKNSPDENEIVSAVEQGLDGNATVVCFIVARHYLGNRKCTRTYRPTHLDKNAIAEIGEEAFRKLVSKYDGKETQDL